MTDYSAAQPVPGGGTFSVGGVIKRSFGAFFANIVPFGILALILYLPSLIFGFSMDISVGVSVGVDSGGETVDDTPFSTADGIGVVLGFLLTYILVGALVYGTVQYLNGTKAELGEIVKQGLARIVPVAIIALLYSIGFSIGLVLLIIPGIFLMVCWSVVIPASVVERPGIFGAFSRSWHLTKGYRWKILGLLVLMLIILIIISLVVGLVGGIVGGIIAIVTGGASISLLVNYIASAFSGALLSVMIAVLYHDLRVAKEGVSTAQIAAVFD